jgi:NADPH-dependent 2,4-dienoyl-CoA reductase/sulfur reductase-like enzyme
VPRDIEGDDVATTEKHIVVAGAGAAGHSAASTLRQEGYTGPLTVVHGEAHPPYNRTLVNKAVLPGLLAPEQIALPPLDALDVRVLNARVAELDADATELVFEDGERLAYTALVAATGSTPRPARLEGWRDSDRPDRVLQMHTIEDAARIRDLLGKNPSRVSVTLLGAGFIGAETASYLADLGAAVHLVSQPALPLAPVLGDAIAQRVADLHRDHVRTHFGRTVVEVRASTESVTVTLDDGTVLESDLVVVAYGTVPEARWLYDRIDGVPVDDRLRAPYLRGVYAAGSVAVHTASTGQRYRVDHWDAATAQGAHAARTLLHDTVGAPDPGPYAPTTGFTLSLYRHPLAAYGVPVPDAQQRQLQASSDAGVLTTFHAPMSGALTAAAGLAAGRDLANLRGQLQRP